MAFRSVSFYLWRRKTALAEGCALTLQSRGCLVFAPPADAAPFGGRRGEGGGWRCGVKWGKKKARGRRRPPTRPDVSPVPSGISPMTISSLIVWLIMIKELVRCQRSTLHRTSNPRLPAVQMLRGVAVPGAGNERWRAQTLCLNSQWVNSH